MFSYDTDDRRNRALIRVGQSGWSTPLSFEAVGQSFEAIIPREWEDDAGEAHLGITIDHGLGSYKLTKIITIRPRFIVESFLDDAICFRQPGAKEYSILESGAKKDIIFLSNQVARLSLRFGDSTRNKWY
jgi:vacuolar protein sorting-associated protein 13A/C